MAELNELQKKWIKSFPGKAGGSAAALAASPDSATDPSDSQRNAALANPKTKGPMPGLDGMDAGRAQAITPGQVIGPATQVGKAALNWVNKQGVTTIIIENHSSKVLSRVDGQEELTHPKEAKWVKKAPPEIAAAQDGKPGKATITVKTDMLIRGVTRANTSGWVMYEVVGEAKMNKVKIAWLRKGDGTLDTGGWGTESAKYEIRGFQSAEGEFTFRFTETAPATKPKDPQPTEDKKPKEPQTPTDTKAKSFEYAIGPFVTGKHDKLESGSVTKHAHDILNDKDKLDGKVSAGLKIEVHGYTSNTDTADRNFVLSKQRAEAVIKALKEVGIPATAIAEPRPHGEWETTPATDDKKQEKEDRDWRKVVVKVSQ